MSEYKEELLSRLSGYGTRKNIPYTSSEIIKYLNSLLAAMFSIIDEKEGLSHFSNREFYRRFKDMMQRYQLEDTPEYQRFRTNISHLSKELGSVNGGKRGEHIAKQILNQVCADFGDVEVLYNVALERNGMRTEYDALIVSPCGILCVEVKNYSHNMKINRNGILVYEDTGKPAYNLVERLAVKENLLRSVLNKVKYIPIKSVLFYTGNSSTLKDYHRETTVVFQGSAKRTFKGLLSYEPLLHSSEVEQIITTLKSSRVSGKGYSKTDCEAIKEDFAELMDMIRQKEHQLAVKEEINQKLKGWRKLLKPFAKLAEGMAAVMAILFCRI